MFKKKSGEKQNLAIMLAKISYTVLFAALVVGALLLCVEAFIRGDFLAAKKWLTENDNPFILNYLIIFVFFLLFLGLFNDLLFSTLAFVLFMMVLAYINRYKFMFLGENLYPWDIFLYQQMFNLLPELVNEINKVKLAIAMIGLVIAIAAILFSKKKLPFTIFKLGFLKRMLLIVVSICLIVSFFLFRTTPLKHLFTKLQITNINWNQEENYNKNGFVLSFVLNTESTLVFPPQGYGKEKILTTVQELRNYGSTKKPPQTLQQHPNIIMIMNEAFWDPTQLQAVSFSEDPLPTVRKHQIGWLLSPQFGGGTANIEFEVLTGLNVSFLPTGSIAYQQFVKKPLPSLATVLAAKGYEPSAIHPYFKWFWSREDVYQQIGFHEFISLDQFEGAQYRGPYISDKEVNKKIISKTEATKKPDFIYAVTMQNHGPYEKNRYSDVKIKLENNNLSEEARSNLEMYTQGVVEADEAFAELIQYYEKSKEPTMIIFFGDHLPFLGADYLAYKEAGFVDAQWSLEEYQKMKMTPLAVWSNFETEKLELPSISASFLAPHILELAQIEKPLFYQFLQHFNEQLPGFTESVKNDKNGQLYKATPAALKPLEETYMQLQYDLLFGKQHGKKELFGNIK